MANKGITLKNQIVRIYRNGIYVQTKSMDVLKPLGKHDTFLVLFEKSWNNAYPVENETNTFELYLR